MNGNDAREERARAYEAIEAERRANGHFEAAVRFQEYAKCMRRFGTTTDLYSLKGTSARW